MADHDHKDGQDDHKECVSSHTIELHECTVGRQRSKLMRKLLRIATGKAAVFGKHVEDALLLLVYVIHFQRCKDLLALAQPLYDELKAKMREQRANKAEYETEIVVGDITGFIQSLRNRRKTEEAKTDEPRSH